MCSQISQAMVGSAVVTNTPKSQWLNTLFCQKSMESVRDLGCTICNTSLPQALPQGKRRPEAHIPAPLCFNPEVIYITSINFIFLINYLFLFGCAVSSLLCSCLLACQGYSLQYMGFSYQGAQAPGPVNFSSSSLWAQ